LTNLPVEVDALLTPAEVATVLYVDPKTVTRWAVAGKVSCVRTPGGHRRFLTSEILVLATANTPRGEAHNSPPLTRGLRRASPMARGTT
jgi:excisionase family DNA binding protein